MRTSWPALLLLSALTLGACDSSTSLEEEATATFRAELSGPLTGTLEGTAEAGGAGATHAGDDVEAFLVFDDLFRGRPGAPDLTGFGLLLASTDDGRHEVITINYVGAELPTTGTYPVGGVGFRPGEGGAFWGGFSRTTEEGFESYMPGVARFEGAGGAASSGTVTIDTFTDDRLAGRFELSLPVRVFVSREALDAFAGQVERGEEPALPEISFTTLDEPLVITGTFDARRLPDVER